MKRQMVQIPVEQVDKLMEIGKVRKDLKDYSISKKVHTLLQEKLKDILNEKENKGEWLEYIREVLPVHVMAWVFLGIVRNSHETIGRGYTKILVTNDAEKSWWGNYKKDIYNVGNYLLRNLKDKKFRENYFKKYDMILEKTKEVSERLRKLDFSKMSDDRLLKEYSRSLAQFKLSHGMMMDIDAVDICLDEAMRKHMDKEEYIKLTELPSLPNIKKERLQMLEIAKSGKLSRLKDLADKYFWISMGWNSGHVRSEKDYRDELKSIDNTQKEIDKLKIKKVTKKPKDNLSKYYTELFDRYFILHDRRKEVQMRATFVLNKFLHELSQRTEYKFNDLQWCFPWEIVKILEKDKVNLKEIKKRQESFFMIITEEGIEQHTGKKAIQRRNEELMSGDSKIWDFSGTTASVGKVTGNAKVCFSSEEAIKKVKDGDILFTSMTTPDYLPAMKKAKAIVTDEGGVTCHAAIVSRELNIPCIVGTKIGTKAVNNNDLVEVNANHSRVKILKKN